MNEDLESLVNNRINGNLGEAKRQAAFFENYEIRDAFIEAGYSEHKATLTADWLKGRDCWQESCDAA